MKVVNIYSPRDSVYYSVLELAGYKVRGQAVNKVRSEVFTAVGVNVMYVVYDHILEQMEKW